MLSVANKLSFGLLTSLSKRFLLNLYEGAAAAYSLQRLSSDTTNVVRVRESVGDTEANFTAQQVSGGALREFALQNDADLIRFANQASATDKRMYFDGVNDYVNLTGQYGSAGRIELKVVLPSAQSRYTKLIGNRTTPSVDGIFLQIDDVAGLIIKAYVNNSSALQTPALSVGQEHEIALAWGSGSVELFLDGVSVGTDTYTGAITPKNLLLGYFAGPYFKGLIYDVRHYSDAAGTTLVNSYNGYGNTNADWEDQVGSGDGIVVGAPALFSGQGFDAYVTTLYDQSGNGRDATQATAASQPQIVADGVVVTDSNGNAAMDFDGIDDHMSSAAFTAIPQPFAGICVSQLDSAGNNQDSAAMGGGASNQFILSFQQNNYAPDEWQAYAGTLVKTGVVSDNNLNLHNAVINGASSEYWLNGSSVAQANFGANSITAVGVGCATAIPLLNGPWFGLVHEIILYPSDITANRAAIESKIAERYGITLA